MKQLKGLLVAMFAHQYAWFLYRCKRSRFSANWTQDFLIYQYLAVAHGSILALLVFVLYVVFLAQYIAFTVAALLFLAALTVPTVFTIRVYKRESRTIKRMGKKIFASADGAPYSSLAIGLSSAWLGLVLIAVLVLVMLLLAPV